MTGSPLVTVWDTLPPSSPQHSTSTKRVRLSAHVCVSRSNRREVDAKRKLVTLAPLGSLLRCGELTTLPTTVRSVSFTVLLRWNADAPVISRGEITVQCRGPAEQRSRPVVDSG